MCLWNLGTYLCLWKLYGLDERLSKCLLVLHVVSSYPGTQVQVNALTPSTQVPPLSQVTAAQSSMSEMRSSSIYRMLHHQTIFRILHETCHLYSMKTLHYLQSQPHCDIYSKWWCHQVIYSTLHHQVIYSTLPHQTIVLVWLNKDIKSAICFMLIKADILAPPLAWYKGILRVEWFTFSKISN